jgi:transcriptional antiterminator RfaH
MGWHVLHLRPRSEKKVAEICVAYGLDHYLPLREETKIYQRRKVKVQIPMFPCYLFVSFEPEDRIHLQKTNHIIKILEPPSEKQLIQQLEQIRLALNVDPSLGVAEAIKQGRAIRIRGGPFMGVEGVVASERNAGKVRLNVEMIGQAVVIDIDRDLVELLD